MTGATGFVGSHLVDALLGRNWSVRCLVRANRSSSRVQGLPVEVVHGDCRDPASLRDAVRGVDVVFHVAGIVRGLNARAFLEVNAIGTHNLLRAAAEFNPATKAFIHVSSQAAAGPSGGNASRESDMRPPISAYGRSKRQAEELVLAQSAKIPIVIIRPPIVYGPRDRNFLPIFRLVSKGIQPCIAGKSQRFSICYVDDLVRGLLLASDKEAALGQVFFLSDGREYGWEDVGNAVALAAGRKVRQLPVPKFFVMAGALAGEAIGVISRKPPTLNFGRAKEMVGYNWVCDINKSRNLLGFEPRVTLEEGIGLTLRWYKEAKWL